jgi:glycosyltransferase involved in cell wall biosynthesis
MAIRGATTPGLTVVGDGSARGALERLAQELRVESHITFTGWLDHDQVGKYMDDAVALVIPSIWPENFPTVVLEALAAGTPVIGSRVGGIPELVTDGETGLLIEPRDASALAAALDTAATKDWPTSAATSRQTAIARFDMERFVDHVEQCYTEVLVAS